MQLDRLKEPFAPENMEWRVQSSGMGDNGPWARVVPFVDSRTIMNRLDEAVGIENWQNRFERGPDGGVICGISIRVGDEWVTKWDGTESPEEEKPDADRKNHVDPVKTGLTNAFKRAAVQWGIGRYLYGIASGYAVICNNGRYSARIQGKTYRWNPPEIPGESGGRRDGGSEDRGAKADTRPSSRPESDQRDTGEAATDAQTTAIGNLAKRNGLEHAALLGLIEERTGRRVTDAAALTKMQASRVIKALQGLTK